MKSYTVVGYADTEHGCCYCLDHGDPNTMSPIFADSEWDYYPSCDTCHSAITDVNLTTEGQIALTQQSRWYNEGYDRGYNIASEIALDRIDEHRTVESFLEDCAETEDNDRQFSPFEFTAHELNSGRYPSADWDDFDEGIAAGFQMVATKYFPEERSDK